MKEFLRGSPAVPQRPSIKPWWRLLTEQNRAVFQYGDGAVICRGKAVGILFPELLPLLDGERTVDEIVRVFDESKKAAIVNVLDLLARNGILMEGSATPDQLLASGVDTVRFFAATQGVVQSLGAYAEALRTFRFAILGNSKAGSEMARALSDAGANVTKVPWPVDEDLFESVDLAIAAPSAFELPNLTRWNGLAIARGVTWLQVLPFDGRFASVGPIYIPGETGCYECFRLRRSANVSYPDEFWAIQDTPASFPSTIPLDLTLAGLTTLMALRWALYGDSALWNRFYAIEVGMEVATSIHAIYRAPRCKACSEISAVASPGLWFEVAREWIA